MTRARLCHAVPAGRRVQHQITSLERVQAVSHEQRSASVPAIVRVERILFFVPSPG